MNIKKILMIPILGGLLLSGCQNKQNTASVQYCASSTYSGNGVKVYLDDKNQDKITQFVIEISANSDTAKKSLKDKNEKVTNESIKKRFLEQKETIYKEYLQAEEDKDNYDFFKPLYYFSPARQKAIVRYVFFIENTSAEILALSEEKFKGTELLYKYGGMEAYDAQLNYFSFSRLKKSSLWKQLKPTCKPFDEEALKKKLKKQNEEYKTQTTTKESTDNDE